MNKLFALPILVATLALPALADDDLEAACPESVPAALVPAADQRLRYFRPAVGVQIYICAANAAGTTSWLFLAPQANLYKDESDLAGTHFIGPVWQDNDGSSVKAARIAGATVDPTAVPWLLLGTVGNVGPGRFANITTIQRVNTVGGLAPAASTCTPATLGKVAQVAYTTDYFLYDTHTPGPNGNSQCR